MRGQAGWGEHQSATGKGGGTAPAALHLCPPPSAASPRRRALVPTLHASDLGTAKGLRKYKEGQAVEGRVLTVNPGAQGRGAQAGAWRRRAASGLGTRPAYKGRPRPSARPQPAASKKVTVTLKPSVVGSKLPPITATADAVPGGRSHGVVTGAADFGVFVSFFGGVTGAWALALFWSWGYVQAWPLAAISAARRALKRCRAPRRRPGARERVRAGAGPEARRGVPGRPGYV